MGEDKTGGVGTGGDSGTGSGADPSLLGSPGGTFASATLDRWREAIPKEIQHEPVFAQYKDLPTLLKSFLEKERRIGVLSSASIPRPSKNWTEQQWNEFYTELGRPKSDGEYQVPEFKSEEGGELDPAMLDAAKKAFFKAGLTGDQAKSVLEFYWGTVSERMKADKAAKETAKTQAVQALQGEWGANYNARVDLAKLFVRQFGGDEFVEYLNETGLGNDPRLIKVLASAGEKLMEDRATGTGAGSFGVKPETTAIVEMNKLKMNRDFMEALNDQYHPNHKLVLDQWMTLLHTAYPKEVEKSA